MREPAVIPPGEGEVVGDSRDRRVEILSDCDPLHATWSRFGPGREGADLHVHHRHSDLFYVLEGELTLRLGVENDSVPIAAGTLVRVPPLVVHGFRNASDTEVRYLNFHAPGRGFASFMRALRDGRDLPYDQHPPPADGGRPPADVVIGTGAGPLADVEEIGVCELEGEPGAAPPAPHVHGRHVESFYVLEGELALTMGGRELRGPAGTWLQVPPGVPHTVSFPRSEPARFLDLHTPSCGLGASDQQPAG